MLSGNKLALMACKWHVITRKTIATKKISTKLQQRGLESARLAYVANL